MTISKKRVAIITAFFMLFTVFSAFICVENVNAATNGNNVKAVYKYLRKTQGFTKQGALASVAVMDVESGVNPTASDGTCYGICQWAGNRKTNLRKQKNYNTLKVQEKFFITELKNFKQINTVKKSKDVSACVKYLVKHYTRPGIDYSATAIKRANTLKKKYKLTY